MRKSALALWAAGRLAQVLAGSVVMVVAGLLGCEYSWTAPVMLEELERLPAEEAGTGASVAEDMGTEWTVVQGAESREFVIEMAQVGARPMAPGTAEACETAGRDGHPVREVQMAGQGEGTVTVADPGECLGPADCNKAAAPAAHNHLVPAVRMPSTQMSSTTLIRYKAGLMDL